MTLNPIGNSKYPIAENNKTVLGFLIGGAVVCVITALFKSAIQELFQTKKNLENVTAQSNELIDQRQIQQNQNSTNNLNNSNVRKIITILFPEITLTEEQENEIKKLEDSGNFGISKILENLFPGLIIHAELQETLQQFENFIKEENELRELCDNTTKRYQEFTGRDPEMIRYVCKKHQKPEEIEAFLLQNLMSMPPDLISCYMEAYVTKSYFQDPSVDELSIDPSQMYERSDHIKQCMISIGKKIAREIEKLSPKDQKVVRGKLFKGTAKGCLLLEDQINRGSNSNCLVSNSMRAQHDQYFCDLAADLAASEDFKNTSGRIRRSNEEDKYAFRSLELAKKFGEAKKELTGIAEDLKCSIPELVIRCSPRIIGESGEEIAFSDTTIYVLLENARKFLRDQLLEEEESRKTRQKARNEAKSKRNHEPQTEPICIPTREETSSAAKSQKNVSNHQQNVTKQSNHSIGTNDGFIQVRFRNETSSSNTPLKINFNQQIPVDPRVLRWDCSSDKSSETFLNEIKNFTDKNSTKRYFHMSEEDLIDQQRRHNIPYIEILLAQKWFLKNYALKIHNPEDPFSERYFLLVESFLGKNSLGVEMLSIGLARNHAEPLLYHCFIHPQEEFLSFESKNHSFKNLVDTTHTMATRLPSKRSSLPKITVLDQPDGSRKVRVSGEDSFTSDHRTLVFLPVNLMNRNK